MSFLYLQGWRLHDFSGHLHQCLINLRVNNLVLKSNNFLSPGLAVATGRKSVLSCLCVPRRRVWLSCLCALLLGGCRWQPGVPLSFLSQGCPDPVSPVPVCPELKHPVSLVSLHQLAVLQRARVCSVVGIPELNTGLAVVFPWTEGRGDLPPPPCWARVRPRTPSSFMLQGRTAE